MAQNAEGYTFYSHSDKGGGLVPTRAAEAGAIVPFNPGDAMKRGGLRFFANLPFPEVQGSQLSKLSAVDIIAASYQAEDRFREATEKIDQISQIDQRAQIHLTVAKALIVAGRSPDNDIKLARTYIDQLEDKRPPLSSRKDSPTYDMRGERKLVTLLSELGVIYLVTGNIPEAVESLTRAVNYIGEYALPEPSSKPGTVNYQYDTAGYLERCLIRAEDAATLAEKLLVFKGQPEIDTILDKIDEEMIDAGGSKFFITHASNLQVARGYNGTIKLKAYLGDIRGIQDIAENLADISLTQTDSTGQQRYYRDSADILFLKAEALALVAAFESQISRNLSLNDLTPSQIDEILQSANSNALAAFGRACVEAGVDPETIIEERKLDPSSQDMLWSGYETGLRIQQQELQKKLQIAAARRRNTKSS